ncbi:MAG: ATP-binding protein [Eubacteriales bacterium]
MKEMQRILSFTRRALSDYEMIRPHDKIAVGLSGGKDSLTLLTALAALRRFYPVPFELCAITVNVGFPDSDFSRLTAYCESLGVPLRVVDTDIARVVFDIRREPNPCALCAKMRRGALHRAAREMGCTRVALGHHFDDVVVTFMLNLFFEGRLGCFSPVTYLSNTELYLIRPLLYAKEKDIRQYVRQAGLPVTPSCCPEDKHTERERMTQLLHELEKSYPGLRHRLYTALCKGNIDGFRLFGELSGDL